MSSMPSPISFQFDFDNPEGWSAHRRRDFIEDLAVFMEQSRAGVLTVLSGKIGVNLSSEPLGRVHTPWVGEHATRVKFQPTVPAVLIDNAQMENGRMAQKFHKGLFGGLMVWLAQTLSKKSKADVLNEMEHGVLEKRLRGVATQWGAALVDPMVRILGPWLAQRGKNGVVVTICAPDKNITVTIPASMNLYD